MGNPRYKNGHLRRKIRAQVLREEHHCWICGQTVNTQLTHGQPLSPEIDEILPVSRGGNPLDRTNCRLAHRICNQKRGAGTQEVAHMQLEQITKPIRTTRNW